MTDLILGKLISKSWYPVLADSSFNGFLVSQGANCNSILALWMMTEKRTPWRAVIFRQKYLKLFTLENSSYWKQPLCKRYRSTISEKQGHCFWETEGNKQYWGTAKLLMWILILMWSCLQKWTFKWKTNTMKCFKNIYTSDMRFAHFWTRLIPIKVHICTQGGYKQTTRAAQTGYHIRI